MNYNFLSLTNANPKNAGEMLALRRNHIVSVFTTRVIREEGGEPESVTCVFAPPYGTWEVKETYAEVFKQLNKTEDGASSSSITQSNNA